GTDYSRRSWLCRSASAPSQRAGEPVQDRCSGPCSRPGHAAGWRSRNRVPAGWVAWATNAITEGREPTRCNRASAIKRKPLSGDGRKGRAIVPRAIDRLILGILGNGSVELVVRSHLGI